MHTIVRDKVFPFIRQEIHNAIPISDVPKEEPSFFDRENDTLSRSPAFRVLCMNLNDHAYNTTFMRSWLLKELVLFTKFNIEPSSTITELYSRNVLLMNMI